jgi:hypothetical protein
VAYSLSKETGVNMSSLYRPWKHALLTGTFTAGAADPTLDTGNIYAVLVSGGYSANYNTDEFATSLGTNIARTTGGVAGYGSNDIRVSIATAGTGITITTGTMDVTAASTTWSTVIQVAAETYSHCVFYKDNGTTYTNAPMLVDITFTAVTPNGGNIIITWDTTTSLNGVTGGVFGL